MQVTKKIISDSRVRLTFTVDDKVSAAAKKEVLEKMAVNLALPGFRAGKAPLNMVEKHADQRVLQTEFLELAVNYAYNAVVEQEQLRPVEQPNVTIKKFVPFDTLEIEVEVEVLGPIKLADYKKFRLAKKPVTVTDKDVEDVIKNLQARTAEKKDVDRSSKMGDQIWIDFDGKDAKTKEVVNGASGDNYPLALGSNTFIPGFEENLAGLKSGEEKTFDLKFPKDYGVAALQGRAVTFHVTVIKVQEVVEPKVDGEFAAKIGPFKTVAELNADIKNQLGVEKQEQADRAYNDELLTKITEKSTIIPPEILVKEQVDRLVEDQKRNVAYKGQTWEELLSSEGLSEEEYRKKLTPEAELRVKAGLVLSEIAEKEDINVTTEELDTRMQLLKGQYKDAAMLAELEKPNARREIASRMVSEKTMDKLVGYATDK